MQRWRRLQACTQDGDLSSLDPNSTYAQDSNGLVFRELHANSIRAQFENALDAIAGGNLIFVF